MTVATSNKFRTNDMVLSTLLYMAGNEYKHEVMYEGGRRVCVWVFDVPTDPDTLMKFEDVLSDFEQHTGKVEPRTFARCWADVRRAMFQFLGREQAWR